jgi:peptidylprolyl isomerase
MEKIKNGDTVTVHYTGTLDDGNVFDSSRVEGREPFTFQVGAGQVIPGFESGIIGAAAGETKKIVIESTDAYGDRDENLIFEVEVARLPAGIETGSQLQLMTPQGPMIAVVSEISENGQMAKIDHNHPLAGQRLNFELEILNVETTVEA